MDPEKATMNFDKAREAYHKAVMYVSKDTTSSWYKEFYQYKASKEPFLMSINNPVKDALSGYGANYQQACVDYVTTMLAYGLKTGEELLQELESDIDDVEDLVERYKNYKQVAIEEEKKKRATLHWYMGAKCYSYNPVIDLAAFGLTEAEKEIGYWLSGDAAYDDYRAEEKANFRDVPFNAFSDCEWMKRELGDHEKPHLGGNQ